MDKLVDNYTAVLEEQINKINGLNREINQLKTFEERMDLLSFCMGVVERAENDLLIFKENHLEYDIPSVVDYDYWLSDYAERFYKQASLIISITSKNADNDVIRMIPMRKKELLMNLTSLMMKISARWNIERMINVFEFDTPARNKAFPKRKPLLEECIFFANRMNATRMGVHFKDGIMPKKIIFAVQPSSGKSFLANVYSVMALCLNDLYFKISGILRMSNNSGNACGFADQIKAMIENEKIVSIYPEFSKYFVDGKSKMLEKSTSEEWKLADLDPRIRASHFARGRDSAINSIRTFVALIIDDLSDGATQMNNDEAHKAMTANFYIDMDARQEDENLPVFILGTMFNEFDIQNTMISQLEDAGLLIKDDNFKNVRRTPDYSTIVITVDCFDENGNSVAPKLVSTEKLRERQNNLKPYEFDLVYRQIRSSREPRIFDYNNLKTYSKLPETLKSDRIAVLDPTRKNGADFFSMPILAFNTAEDDRDAYFVDCVYEQKSLGKLSDPNNRFFMQVIQAIISNNVKELCIENNTSNTIGTLFEEKFKQLNYYCKILEFYTAKERGTKNKLEKICNEEASITANIRFPKPQLYPVLHRISRFMSDFTRFDSKLESGNKKQHDDAPDSLAIFSKRYLFNRANRLSSVVGSFSRKSLWKM